MRRIPQEFRELLDGSGLPWRAEVGKRHFKITVNERLATILPLSRPRERLNSRAYKNSMAQLRRIIREQGGEEHGRR